MSSSGSDVVVGYWFLHLSWVLYMRMTPEFLTTFEHFQGKTPFDTRDSSQRWVNWGVKVMVSRSHLPTNRMRGWRWRGKRPVSGALNYRILFHFTSSLALPPKSKQLISAGCSNFQTGRKCGDLSVVGARGLHWWANLV